MGDDSLTFVTVERGGEYLRVADPDWIDPLDPSYSQVDGGRWNPRGAFPVLYLNADIATARANAAQKYAGLSYGLTDLRPERRPILVSTDVPPEHFVDIVTEGGCLRAGLPVSYPVHPAGREVTHAECQPVGVRVKEQRKPGIACRSAARPSGEELAWFTGVPKRATRTRAFDDWYWEPPHRV